MNLDENKIAEEAVKRGEEKSEQNRLKLINVASLEGRPIPNREWLVTDYVPMGCVTALYGDGGVGKSLLAQQLMTMVALGEKFLGMETTRVKSLGFFCEDTEDELHRRQFDVNTAFGLSFSQLENITLCSRTGDENVLMSFKNSDGTGNIERLYDDLEKIVLDLDARLIVIDTAADTFGGNENVRPQVRRFINLLSRLAVKVNGAVLLCAHPSQHGLMTGDGSGGSTAWNNTVRSRFYLERKKIDKDDQQTQNMRKLSKKKANYSSIGGDIEIEWNNGAFLMPDNQKPDLDDPGVKMFKEKTEEGCFLKCLDRLMSQGINVSHSKNAENFAPKKMLNQPETGGLSQIRIKMTMERLFQKNLIEVGELGLNTNRHPKMGIRRVNQNNPESL